VGLMIQAGPNHMPRSYVNGPLGGLLPVKLEAAGPGEGTGVRDGLEAPAFAPFRMRVTATGAIHPAFQLYENTTQNRHIWSRMPEYYWASATLEAVSAATVLARVEGPGIERPLIVEGYAGRGRVMFIGTDSTYRWRRNIGNHLFYRFWGQAIRHVARNDKRHADKSWIEVQPERIEPGGQVSIEIYAVDKHGKPLDKSELSVQIASADANDRVLLSRTPEPGLFRGFWYPKTLGQYRLNCTDTQDRVVTAMVSVAGSGRELRRPSVDRDTLGTLADATGGGLLELDQLHRLLEVIQGEPKEVDQPYEDDIWDNWITLVLLVGLYCTDVGVRRMLRLT